VVEDAIAEFGHIESSAPTPGSAARAVWELTDEWQDTIDVNLTGCGRHPGDRAHMIEQGRGG